MSSLYRPVLAPLPLLLWKTPPGLELILAQEGIAFEVVRDAHPFAFRRGRFVLFDGQQTDPGRLRAMLTHEHVAIDIDLLRGNEPVDPFQALIDHQAARGIWKFRGWNLRERVSRYPKAWIRRRLIEALRQQVLAAGRSLDPPGPLSSSLPVGLQFPGRSGRAGPGGLPPVRPDPQPAGRLLHPFREHPRLRRSARGARRPEAVRHAVARPFSLRLSRSGGEPPQPGACPPAALRGWVRALGIRRAARALEPGPGRRPRVAGLRVLVGLPARL